MNLYRCVLRPGQFGFGYLSPQGMVHLISLLARMGGYALIADEVSASDDEHVFDMRMLAEQEIACRGEIVPFCMSE